jgi:hypothetical protein
VVEGDRSDGGRKERQTREAEGDRRGRREVEGDRRDGWRQERRRDAAYRLDRAGSGEIPIG